MIPGNQKSRVKGGTLLVVAASLSWLSRTEISREAVESPPTKGPALEETKGYPRDRRFAQVTDAEKHLRDTGECRGCDLKRSELMGLSLVGSDLEGAHLQGTDLSSSDLSYANLRGAILRRADLSSVKSLVGTDLSGADLTEANVKEADLEQAILCDTVLPSGLLSERCDETASTIEQGGAS